MKISKHVLVQLGACRDGKRAFSEIFDGDVEVNADTIAQFMHSNYFNTKGGETQAWEYIHWLAITLNVPNTTELIDMKYAAAAEASKRLDGKQMTALSHRLDGLKAKYWEFYELSNVLMRDLHKRIGAEFDPQKDAIMNEPLKPGFKAQSARELKLMRLKNKRDSKFYREFAKVQAKTSYNPHQMYICNRYKVVGEQYKAEVKRIKRISYRKFCEFAADALNQAFKKQYGK